MRRLFVYASVAVVILAAATYWLSKRELVVERPSLGGPPPQARQHENLVGRAAPTFSALDLSGQPAGTRALRGRIIVLNVWATWCLPCRDEMPRLEREVWQRFKPEVAVVAVARGEPSAKILAFNQQAKLTFSLVEDPKSNIARSFGGDDMIPRTYVIDRSGVIVYQTIAYGEKSFANLVSAVDRAVAQRSTAP